MNKIVERCKALAATNRAEAGFHEVAFRRLECLSCLAQGKIGDFVERAFLHSAAPAS